MCANQSISKMPFPESVEEGKSEKYHLKFEVIPEGKRSIPSQTRPWAVNGGGDPTDLEMLEKHSNSDYLANQTIHQFQKCCNKNTKTTIKEGFLNERKGNFYSCKPILEKRYDKSYEDFERDSLVSCPLEMKGILEQEAASHTDLSSIPHQDVQWQESPVHQATNTAPHLNEREMSPASREVYQSGLDDYSCPPFDSKSTSFSDHVKKVHRNFDNPRDKKRQGSVSLKQQIESVIQAVKKHGCPHCPFGSSSIHNLKRHVNAIHHGIKNYSCPHCQYKGSQSSTLKRHIEAIHQGIKRYSCPHCQYKCSHNGNLRQHIEAIHQGIKRYSCPHCQYKCSRSGDLKQHVESIHQGIKKYSCPHCQYMCSHIGHLKKHVEAIHQGIRKYCCPHCQFTCSWPGSLKKHIEAIHQGI